MRFRLIALFIATLLINIFACSPESNTISSPEAVDIAPSNVSSQDDIEILPQFQIELRPDGQIRTGRINLTATLKANVDSPSLQFQVILPDLEIARQNDWTSRRRWTALSFPALIDQYRSLGRGQTTTEPIAINVPVPGYYRIILMAKADPVSSGIGEPLIQNIVQEEYWLWVGDNEGALGRSMERHRFPEASLVRPGPLTPTPERVQQNRGLAPSGYTSTVFQVRYVNSDSSNILTPVPNTLVKYTIFDQYENQVIGQGQFYTDASGNFTADCPYEYGWETYTYEVYAEDSDSAVLPGTSIWGATLYPNDPYCQNTTNVADVSQWARVFTNLKVVVPSSQTLLGYSRGKISVISASGASYNPSTDKINYPTSAIWGSAGRFTIGHEYGHAVHEKALGGLNPGYADSCDPHYVGSASSYGCALSEGFADFLPVGIWGNRSAYFNEVVALQSVSTGPKVEGAVAAFLFDLIDGTTSGETSESHDGTQYPGSYVATILKTCKYNTSNRASGIDHIVYCLEKSLSSRTGHHWSDRSAVSSYSEGATEPPSWSATAIYNNWHWNIYRH